MYIVVSLKKDNVVSVIEKDKNCLLQFKSEVKGFFIILILCINKFVYIVVLFKKIYIIIIILLMLLKKMSFVCNLKIKNIFTIKNFLKKNN